MQDTPFITLITTSISNFGFPIVLTGYLLMRSEKKIEALNTTILELLQLIRDEVRNK
ncbi:YvrJ family protein [Paenibacillus sp. SYP-B3998]|uniref:YvrJ family protein n=1 Tax=Paenibacillus sp. SYP-B3998 TaxID=2678564 RepID=A0A6G4A270_9BACL|nr:YvrJ family protein [Paenibacillus sp. SYP-B3998]NEW07921.1 YvrJ family protein [Paenibacillus sp. SYP-B3998]